jgi:hypothetical protein
MQLRVRKVGRRTLILKEDAEAWLQSLPIGVTGPGSENNSETGEDERPERHQANRQHSHLVQRVK